MFSRRECPSQPTGEQPNQEVGVLAEQKITKLPRTLGGHGVRHERIRTYPVFKPD